MLAWHSVMLTTYKENYPSFFLLKSAICQLVALLIYNCAGCDGNY